MTDTNEFDLGRVLFEARKREAWGQLAQQMIDRDPWPKHVAAPRSAEHDLAMAQARAVLAYTAHIADLKGAP